MEKETTKPKSVDALVEMADIMLSASNDFHCLHFNVLGLDFDTMHKKVLKTYYEQAAGDYDELNEKARSLGAVIPNGSSAASRVGYTELQGALFDRLQAVHESQQILESICNQMLICYRYFNQIEECPICVGVANYLQGRLEYWSKEMAYFNKARSNQV